MLSMLATDIQSKTPHRQELAEAVAIYLACGGEIVAAQPVVQFKKQWGGTFHPTADVDLRNQSLTESIRKLVAEGRGVMTICQNLKLSPKSVHALAAKAGFVVPKRTTASNARQAYAELRNEKRAAILPDVLKMRAQGMLIKEISSATGFSKPTISRWIRDANGE